MKGRERAPPPSPSRLNQGQCTPSREPSSTPACTYTLHRCFHCHITRLYSYLDEKNMTKNDTHRGKPNKQINLQHQATVGVISTNTPHQRNKRLFISALCACPSLEPLLTFADVKINKSWDEIERKWIKTARENILNTDVNTKTSEKQHPPHASAGFTRFLSARK